MTWRSGDDHRSVVEVEVRDVFEGEVADGVVGGEDGACLVVEDDCLHLF